MIFMLFQIIDSFDLLSIVNLKPIMNRKLLDMAKILIRNMSYYYTYTMASHLNIYSKNKIS